MTKKEFAAFLKQNKKEFDQAVERAKYHSRKFDEIMYDILKHL